MVSLCHQPDWVWGPHRNTPLGVSKRILQRDLTAERRQTMGGTIPCWLRCLCVGGIIPQAEVQDWIRTGGKWVPGQQSPLCCLTVSTAGSTVSPFCCRAPSMWRLHPKAVPQTNPSSWELLLFRYFVTEIRKVINTVVLNLWIPTPFGIEWRFHKGHLRLSENPHIYVINYNSSKNTIMK